MGRYDGCSAISAASICGTLRRDNGGNYAPVLESLVNSE